MSTTNIQSIPSSDRTAVNWSEALYSIMQWKGMVWEKLDAKETCEYRIWCHNYELHTHENNKHRNWPTGSLLFWSKKTTGTWFTKWKWKLRITHEDTQKYDLLKMKLECTRVLRKCQSWEHTRCELINKEGTLKTNLGIPGKS